MPKGMAISVEQRRKIHQMIRDNFADVDILNEFGIVKHTLNSIKREVRDGIVPKAKKSGVRKALKKQAGDRDEVKPKKKHIHVTLEERHRIHDMIRNHVPDGDILNEFGFSLPTLYRIKGQIRDGKEPKVTEETKIYVTLEQRHQIYDMIRNHVPDVDILNEFGFTSRALDDFKKESRDGVTPKPHHLSFWELTDHLNTVVDYFLEKGLPVTYAILKRIAIAWKIELDDPALIAKYERASFSPIWFQSFQTQRNGLL